MKDQKRLHSHCLTLALDDVARALIKGRTYCKVHGQADLTASLRNFAAKKVVLRDPVDQVQKLFTPFVVYGERDAFRWWGVGVMKEINGVTTIRAKQALVCLDTVRDV